MAAVEYRPDEGALLADGVDRAADVVVDEGVGHALRAIDPFVDVLGQEDLVEPVGLVACLHLRLLGAVARQVEIDEIALLGLGGDIVERGLDTFMRRRAGRAFDLVGQHGDVLGREFHLVRQALEQEVADEHGVVLWPDQPVVLRQVRIFGACDEQCAIGLRRGSQGAHRRQASGGKGGRAGQECAASQVDHRCLPSPFPVRHIVRDFVSIWIGAVRSSRAAQARSELPEKISVKSAFRRDVTNVTDITIVFFLRY
jgi:hypothetical protein